MPKIKSRRSEGSGGEIHPGKRSARAADHGRVNRLRAAGVVVPVIPVVVIVPIVPVAPAPPRCRLPPPTKKREKQLSFSFFLLY